MHRQLAFTDSHAAAIKDTVIRVEKTMGVVKAYLQLKAVTATKQMASAHAMLRTRAKVSAGSPPTFAAGCWELFLSCCDKHTPQSTGQRALWPVNDS